MNAELTLEERAVFDLVFADELEFIKTQSAIDAAGPKPTLDDDALLESIANDASAGLTSE
jgi:hypothetical protein